jgi:predicted nucleic acid-binding protein
MRVVVNDANVLIDLVKLQLLPQFFALDHVFYTTDFILEELYPEQQEELQTYIVAERLKVMPFNEEELIQVAELQAQKPQLSEQDCSAVVCALMVNGDLLTSDNTLRKFATSLKMIVRGHLWVFDQLLAHGIIDRMFAIAKFTELMGKVNPRLGLPQHECDARIKAWRSI